jgi:hypothetical protein
MLALHNGGHCFPSRDVVGAIGAGGIGPGVEDLARDHELYLDIA